MKKNTRTHATGLWHLKTGKCGCSYYCCYHFDNYYYAYFQGPDVSCRGCFAIILGITRASPKQHWLSIVWDCHKTSINIVKDTMFGNKG